MKEEHFEIVYKLYTECEDLSNIQIKVSGLVLVRLITAFVALIDLITIGCLREAPPPRRHCWRICARVCL